MKIITIFTDMVRANRMQLFEPSLKKKNLLDEYLENLGGTVFSNHITPGPDTPRGLASYFSGVPPWSNGCDTRIKWCSSFLDENIKTNIDLFQEYCYEQFFFSNPDERIVGLFPKESYKFKHNKDLRLKKFLEELDLSEDFHLFISLPDFHWAIDDYGANFLGEKIGYLQLIKSLEILFKNYKPDFFDYIFIFSDHGFKFTQEYKKQSKKNKLYLYNEDRIRPILFIRKKNQSLINYNNNLISICDLNKIYKNILEHNTKKIFNIPKREFICFEDHIDFSSKEFMNTEVFGVVNNEYLYVRNFKESLLLDRTGKFISVEKHEEFDSILKSNTSYGVKYDYINKLPYRHDSICPQNIYTNGSKRIFKSSKIKRKIQNQINKFINN